jgi:integrase
VGCKCEPRREKWEGGYVRHGKRACVFVIQKEVGGQRFHVSTRKTKERDAHRELDRFLADPYRYNPFAPPDDNRPRALRLTAALIDEFCAWNIGRGNTRKHSKEMAARLTEWLSDFDGTDLRDVTLRQIQEALEARRTSRQHRIIALKSFYKWLRKTRGLLTFRDDPTEDISVPVARAAKLKKKKALERERVYAALEKLAGPVRDFLILLMGTGWHCTEAVRFIRDDESSIVHQPAGDILAVLSTWHKIGGFTRTPIRHREHLEAAERLRARREAPTRLNKQIKAACEAAEVEPFTLGVLRHSVATWAIEGGATVAQVAEFLNHRDPRTTRNFYADVSSPTVSVPVLRVLDGGG